MSESEQQAAKRKRATFGVVFLTIFLDMVGFSVIFPLFPAMLDHYLEQESLAGGGLLTEFVRALQGLGFKGEIQNENFRFVERQTHHFLNVFLPLYVASNLRKFSKYFLQIYSVRSIKDSYFYTVNLII